MSYNVDTLKIVSSVSLVLPVSINWMQPKTSISFSMLFVKFFDAKSSKCQQHAVFIVCHLYTYEYSYLQAQKEQWKTAHDSDAQRSHPQHTECSAAMVRDSNT